MTPDPRPLCAACGAPMDQRIVERGCGHDRVLMLLGHADISTTMIYTEVSSQSLDAALMTLSADPRKD